MRFRRNLFLKLLFQRLHSIENNKIKIPIIILLILKFRKATINEHFLEKIPDTDSKKYP